MNFFIKWDVCEKILKIIAVLIIVGIGIIEFVEFIKFHNIQLQLKLDSQNFSNWALPIFTLGGTIALLINLRQNRIIIQNDKSEEYLKFYKEQIEQVTSKKFNGFEASTLLNFSGYIVEKYRELSEKYDYGQIITYLMKGHYEKAKKKAEGKFELEVELEELMSFHSSALRLYNYILSFIKEIWESKTLFSHHKDLLLTIIIHNKVPPYIKSCNLINDFKFYCHMYFTFHFLTINNDPKNGKVFDEDFFKLYNYILYDHPELYKYYERF